MSGIQLTLSVFIHSFKFLMELELSKELLYVLWPTNICKISHQNKTFSFSKALFYITWSVFNSLQCFHWSFIFLSFLHKQVFFFRVILNHSLRHMGPSKMSETLMMFVTKSRLETVKQCYVLVIAFPSSVSILGKPQRFEDG